MIKHVINDNGGRDGRDFTLDSGGANASPDSFPGAERPARRGARCRLYNVTETGPAGYTASLLGRLLGLDRDGQTKTCTVTNDDQPAHLTVIKHVVNDNGGSAAASTFTLNSGGTNAATATASPARSRRHRGDTQCGLVQRHRDGPGGLHGEPLGRLLGLDRTIGQTKTCKVTNDDQPGI